MRVGIDAYTVHHLNAAGHGLLDLVGEFGLDGAQLVDVRQVSPTLDRGELREVSQRARDSGWYLEVGIDSPNPYGRAAGRFDGDFRDYLNRIRHDLEIAADVTVESRAVRFFIGGPGDRYRTDIAWPTQVQATLTALEHLTPVVRATGLKLALENHGDLTTSEVVRIVDRVGTDVLGACFDTGNLPMLLEDAILATQRVAPVTVATHLKDATVLVDDRGLAVMPRACGDGELPLDAVVDQLALTHPDLNLSIEDHLARNELPIYVDSELASLPDASVPELARVLRRARRIADEPWTLSYGDDIWAEVFAERLRRSASYVHRLVEEASAQPARVPGHSKEVAR